jgi:hypothetical protein
MGAKKLQPSEYENALALVEPFRSVDPAREGIHSAFSADLFGRPYVCATDGHTAAMVACAERVPRSADRAPPPPLQYVIPANAERVGHFLSSELEGLRQLPKAWTSVISFEPGELPRLNLTRIKGAGRTEKRIEIVKGAALTFVYSLEVATAFQVGYLLQAIDFCGVERVTVWRERDGRKAELNPVLFTCGAGSYAGEADRVAIVMPCRK